MSGFEWKKEYELGIERIDKQHREFFKRVNRLALALYDNKGRDELKQLISYLKSHIEEHFSYEEALLSRTEYPKFNEHVKKHQELVNYFLNLEHEIKSRGADNYLAIRVERDIREWWEDHELNYDSAYVPYVSGLK